MKPTGPAPTTITCARCVASVIGAPAPRFPGLVPRLEDLARRRNELVDVLLVLDLYRARRNLDSPNTGRPRRKLRHPPRQVAETGGGVLRTNGAAAPRPVRNVGDRVIASEVLVIGQAAIEHGKEPPH